MTLACKSLEQNNIEVVRQLALNAAGVRVLSCSTMLKPLGDVTIAKKCFGCRLTMTEIPMREDLKDRLRKLFQDTHVQIFNAILQHWKTKPGVIWDVESMWIFDLSGAPWPDSRVEAFLNWAEQTEANNGEA